MILLEIRRPVRRPVVALAERSVPPAESDPVIRELKEIGLTHEASLGVLRVLLSRGPRPADPETDAAA